VHGFTSRRLLYQAFDYGWRDIVAEVPDSTPLTELIPVCASNRHSACIQTSIVGWEASEREMASLEAYLRLRMTLFPVPFWSIHIFPTSVFYPKENCVFFSQYLAPEAFANQDTSGGICTCLESRWCECWPMSLQLETRNVSYAIQFQPTCKGPGTGPHITIVKDNFAPADGVKVTTYSQSISLHKNTIRFLVTAQTDPSYHVFNLWTLFPVSWYINLAIIVFGIFFALIMDLWTNQHSPNPEGAVDVRHCQPPEQEGQAVCLPLPGSQGPERGPNVLEGTDQLLRD